MSADTVLQVAAIDLPPAASLPRKYNTAQPFPTAVIGGNGNSVYNRLITAMGRPDMGVDNERYGTDAKRWEHEKEILEVSGRFNTCSWLEWVEGGHPDSSFAKTSKASALRSSARHLPCPAGH